MKHSDDELKNGFARLRAQGVRIRKGRLPAWLRGMGDLILVYDKADLKKKIAQSKSG